MCSRSRVHRQARPIEPLIFFPQRTRAGNASKSRVRSSPQRPQVHRSIMSRSCCVMPTFTNLYWKTRFAVRAFPPFLLVVHEGPIPPDAPYWLCWLAHPNGFRHRALASTCRLARSLIFETRCRPCPDGHGCPLKVNCSRNCRCLSNAPRTIQPPTQTLPYSPEHFG